MNEILNTRFVAITDTHAVVYEGSKRVAVFEVNEPFTAVEIEDIRTFQHLPLDAVV